MRFASLATDRLDISKKLFHIYNAIQLLAAIDAKKYMDNVYMFCSKK
jgi:hypothetical protein